MASSPGFLAVDSPNRLFFISSGPGDPGLVTVKGMEALKHCPFVLAPAQFIDSFSGQLAGKEVQSPFVLTRAELISWIEERLPRGNVAIMVPGDFSIFNPFQSFVADFQGRCEVIPGVSAHVAAMGLIAKSLDVPEVAYASIVTSPKAYARDGHADFTGVAGSGRTLVLYMNDRTIGALAADLKTAYAGSTPIGVFENIGGEDEKVTVATLDTIEAAFGGRDPFGIGSESPEPTLALVVVGEAVATDEAPRWWEHRLEKVWKPRGMR